MNELLNIFTAPRKIFTTLKEKPKWITPFIIVLVIIALTTVINLSLFGQINMEHKAAILRDKGFTEEQIEQATKLNLALVPIIVIGAVITFAVILLVFALILNLLIPVFGGRSLYKTIFSVVCFSALIKVPASILKLILIAITKSLYVSTSLALFVPNLAKTSFGYQLLAGFDFFIIWEMILVALGISITNELKQKNAYILVFLIWIASLFIGIGLGGLFGPRA